jgi:hypothetical protein
MFSEQLRRPPPAVPISSASALDRARPATLVIDHQRIALGDDVDLTSLIDELLEGVRNGGAVVHVVGRDGREHDLIVTPASRAMISHEAMTAGDRSADGPWLAGIDLDH